MPNIHLRKFQKPSMWRKMSLANWRKPSDPQVYGRLEVDMSRAMDYAKSESERTAAKITPTHLIVRAVALALNRFPRNNVVIRWGRIYERRDVDVFCQVAIPGEKPDLSGVIIRNADRKDPAQLADELKQKAHAVRTETDEEFVRTRKSLDRIPQFLYRTVLGFLGFLQYTLNFSLSFLGIPRDPFGSAMVTSIGSLGINEGWAPLVPMSRCPFIVAVGKIEDRAVVVDGQVVIRPICVLSATFDHRIMDGLAGGALARFVTAYLANPEEHEKSGT